MKSIILKLLCFILFIHFQWAEATIRLPQIVGDNMVLQRDTKVKIWGWADSGETVSVSFKGKKYAATADQEGNWSVWLPATKAGGPYNLEITGKDNTLTVNNVLFGDVWLCSGQSNMVHYLDLHKIRYAKEIEAADYPQIRQLFIPTETVLYGPAADLPETEWKEANPENVLRFSVVAYFFAKKIYDQYKIPIGIINSSVGGSPIETWISEAGFKSFPKILDEVNTNKDTAWVRKTNEEIGALRRASGPPREADKGTSGPVKWYEPEYVPVNWNRMNIPGYWEDQGINDLNGTVWFRREFDIPASMTGKPALISMGRIVDADNVYINGQQVGNKTYQYPQRRYEVPADLLKAGKNVIVVRVSNNGGKGGFVPDKPYYLATDGDTLDLKGYWNYKVGQVFRPGRFIPGGVNMRGAPTGFYNGMIAPFIDYPIKGVLWYQGESNTGRPEQYEGLMKALIDDWRRIWNDPQLPFLYAQLPNFNEVDYLPTESNWARLRESQRKVLSVPNTAMAVTLDLGEWNDIHPGNKKPIGDRLALAAQNLVYNDKKVVYSGPLYSGSSVDGNKVTLTFDHTGGGIISKDGEDLRWFAIAGEDKEFVWANTEIRGNQILVWSDEVRYPVYVRYAWMDNPDHINFYNKEGLPASSFEAQVVDLDQLWHGKKAAVVLTYDDALEVHLDNAIPVLDSLGMKGSFYLSGAFPGSKNRVDDWKRAARNGHELGNHTLFHPCDAEGRSWVTPANDLSTYTTEQITREVEMMNVFLESLDGKSERTFAYTCGDTETGEGSFIEAIKDQFVALRGVKGSLNKIDNLNLNNLNCYVVDDNNADQMMTWAEQAKKENALLVILFHGVGGGHSSSINLKSHRDFLIYLKENEPDFWVTTLLEASKHSISQMNKK